MTIADNLVRVREEIAEAANRAGRQAETITLVAVTKTVAPDRIVEAWNAGARDFGENYVQESLGKMRDERLTALTTQGSEAIRWHFIGHLQSNKAREIIGPFALVQSVDSLSLARELNRRAQKAGTVLDVLLQLKIDPIETKFGILPDEAPDAVAQILDMDGLRLRGLMGMAPFGDDPEIARQPFRTLYKIFETLPEPNRQILSMGMSNDFRVAIEEGATLVRIGTAIFGSRAAP